jgi:uncharacterized membrane protein YozB (DUF420 family)
VFGTKASLIVDLFALVLAAIIPLMIVAVVLVRRGRVQAHSRLMVVSFVAFLFATVALELDVHIGGRTAPLAVLPLVIHLCFSVPTLILWIVQVATSKKALLEPTPHRRRGRILFGMLFGTVATGLWLYLATFA